MINLAVKGHEARDKDVIKISIPKGYEFTGVDNQQVVFEKIEYQYPKTYRECAKFINRFAGDKNGGYRCDLITNLQRLIICRDAYWKLYGERMGLDEPWKPDWSTEYEIKYVVEVYRNNVRKNSQGYSNTILAFPTVEMRDAFFENFRHLIEICKELL